MVSKGLTKSGLRHAGGGKERRGRGEDTRLKHVRDSRLIEAVYRTASRGGKGTSDEKKRGTEKGEFSKKELNAARGGGGLRGRGKRSARMEADQRKLSRKGNL